ncbi:MAG: hydrogenase expression/formation protein HypE [Thermodesulfovibrionia bacterium]|nr:hydrogenase expression/formation protein HypE [Thermodesulfovibrionia bacterium]MCK5286664.1 hydrogenase expression/formation protein HypE [Thermodesulfovibrionia bacterium]MCK5426494.1 hydrogenase expression/formation protein HypE [Thermodesulfovibrionia bacterium]
MSKIEIGHGSGGSLTKDLIENIFLKYLNSEELKPLDDASYINLKREKTAITTDSYVVRPLFFPGGNIGKLSVCGTVNDLLVSGSVPEYLSLGFIIEEGFPLDSLETILKSINDTAENAGVRVVTGDTKVVEKNKCDGIYINTTGLGELVIPLFLMDVSDGDIVIITGTVGDHGTAVALARDELHIDTLVKSDCASLHELLIPLFDIEGLKWMRDPTRGGVATALAELSEKTGLGVEVFEEKVPVREDVRFISDMLGYDPLYIANEGKALIITSPEAADRIIDNLKKHPLGRDASVIGRVTSNFNRVRLKTRIGGERVLDLLEEELLPRIC